MKMLTNDQSMSVIMFMTVAAIASVVASAAAIDIDRSKELVWSDEFNQETLNMTNWEFDVNCDGGGNLELQCYSNRTSNIRLENGFLVIEAIPEHFEGKNYTSGRIHNRKSFGWRYGRFEARVRIPAGKWLWPAVWLLPQKEIFGKWAASGEVDMLEAKGENTTQFESTLHFGGTWPNNARYGSGMKSVNGDLSKDFHVIALEWSSEEMVFLCDHLEIFRVNLVHDFWSKRGRDPYTSLRQPFTELFNWVLNLAVGGLYFNQTHPLTPDEAAHWRKTTMEVDYVRVYQ